MEVLAGVAIGSGLIDLIAIARGWKKARYVWKPFTMIVIIALALLGVDWEIDWHRWLLRLDPRLEPIYQIITLCRTDRHVDVLLRPTVARVDGVGKLRE